VTQPPQPEQGMQLPPMQPIDPSNPILNEGPAVIMATPVNTAAGQRLALTIRTPTTTITILLMKDDASRWRDTVSEGISKMNGLIVANGALPKQG
jgi:hypothetical protein